MLFTRNQLKLKNILGNKKIGRMIYARNGDLPLKLDSLQNRQKSKVQSIVILIKIQQQL